MARSNFEHEYSSDGMRRTDYAEETNPYAAKNAFDAWNVNETIFYHNNTKKESLLQIINRRIVELPKHQDYALLNPDNNHWMQKFIDSIPSITDILFTAKQNEILLEKKDYKKLVESFLKEFAQDGWVFNGDYDYPEFSNSIFRGSKSFQYFCDTEWYKDNINANA